MAEQTPFDQAHGPAGDDEHRGRRFDPVSLIAGLAALCGSAYVFFEAQTWIGQLDARWLVAGAAVVIGVIMLAASLRKDR